MERKVRIAQLGLGNIGRRVTRYAQNKGAQIVAAFARGEPAVGRELGEFLEQPPIGVVIQNVSEMDRVLRETKPDICVIATKPSLKDAQEPIETCLKAGVNVLDIGENTFWPWTDDAERAKKLDALAREHGCTISASGYPDVCWGALISAFAASSNTIRKLSCDSFLNLESYNADYMFAYHGVGLTPEEFEQKFGSQAVTETDGHWPCLPGDQNAWLCAKLGLTPVSQTLRYIPILRETDFFSHSLGKIIPAGRLEGLAQVCTTETAEGLTIELKMGGRMDVTGAAEHTVWTLHGEPESTLVWDDPATYELTCATAVNRIPQILNAPPGYVTTDRLPEIRYLAKPMNEYVNL